MLRVDQLPAAYEMLRTFPTFRRLPSSDGVTFQLSDDRATFGRLYVDPSPVVIISRVKHRHAISWLMTLAHEMVHLRLAVDRSRSWDGHGAEFKRHAERVCRSFGWDSEVF